MQNACPALNDVGVIVRGKTTIKIQNKKLVLEKKSAPVKGVFDYLSIIFN